MLQMSKGLSNTNRVEINGQVIKTTGSISISTNGNTIKINNSTFDIAEKDIKIEIYGDATSVETSFGDIIVKGNSGDVKTSQGNIDIEGSVNGDVKTSQGDIRIQNESV